MVTVNEDLQTTVVQALVRVIDLNLTKKGKIRIVCHDGRVFHVDVVKRVGNDVSDKVNIVDGEGA